jgi:hypothetical protein
MKRQLGLVVLFVSLVTAGTALTQDVKVPDEPGQPAPVFLRVTIYPTANLSRYDYNNDIDLYEIRAYVELREKDATGEVISDARIFVMGEALGLKNGHYEKRIRLDKENLVDSVELRILIPDGRTVRENIPIPDWLVISTPRPEIRDSTQDLLVRWKFQHFSAPVDIHAYNFKTGTEICAERHFGGTERTLPADLVPPSTIIRLWVMPSWLSKQFLFGNQYAPGSELLIIPWSQVFIRTK